MVYESDFYTTRRPYSAYRPTTSSYSSVTTPRHYVVVDRAPAAPRRAEEQYSYSYESTTRRAADGAGGPQRSAYSSSVERRTGAGPGGYSYSSERASSLGGPGGYSYSSTSSGRLPHGTTYRYNYRPLTSVYYLSSIPSYLPYYYHYSLPFVNYIPKLSQAELIYRPSARTVTRLSTFPEAPHHIVRVRVRPSVVLRELDRISYKRRPATAFTALDEFSHSESTKNFEDESRRIRADTASLMQRARSVVPRARSVMPLDTIYSYGYGEPMPYRINSDSYGRLFLPSVRNVRSVADTIKGMSFYSQPAKRFTGRGHLACVHYSGNKGFSNRRPLYKELSIRDDVNLLSFYAKNRLAAAGLAGDKATAGGAQEQPTAAQCA